MVTELDVARMALCEAGRPDLAEGVHAAPDPEYGVAVPSHDLCGGTSGDETQRVLVRAFTLAHQLHDRDAHEVTLAGGLTGLCCPTCFPEHGYCEVH